jgi:hypothetical protein
MDGELVIQSFQKEINQLRSKLNQLEVNSIEQQASD